MAIIKKIVDRGKKKKKDEGQWEQERPQEW